jgi:sensor histidine kinase YesM
MIGLKGSIKHLRKANAELKYNLEKNTAKLDQIFPLIEKVEALECERLKNEAKWRDIAPLIAKLQMMERVDDR